ncbi:hypothetical protein [Flavobacterium sp. M31R6]|uniref:hypothetical protein n=1 Tax=Flavobacterium sp. M31R6 TaxID=2739062 RepID=UPI00156A6018|nr:hypothetical protein [Flavobacterium sp. M31R6]QKJ63828.1 hypothetical protein HQN62_12040 [Flavobacterium sp. M31R6]
MAKQLPTQKVNKKQLSVLLDVSYKTGIKEYQIILDSLSLTRKYLTVGDLVAYGLLP